MTIMPTTRSHVWQARHRVGWRLLDLALARDNDPELLAAARREFERAAATHPDPPWFLERNLGLVYERLALHDPTLRRAQLAAWRRYLATAPATDDARPASRRPSRASSVRARRSDRPGDGFRVRAAETPSVDRPHVGRDPTSGPWAQAESATWPLKRSASTARQRTRAARISRRAARSSARSCVS